MRSFWLWFRIAMLSMIFAGLGVYLFATTPWDKWFGRAPDYNAIMTEGDTIVVAIEQFKAQRGLWPEYLDDLAPDYLKTPPGREWFYELTPLGEAEGTAKSTHQGAGMRLLPALSRHADGHNARAHVGYDFDPKNPSWRLFGDLPAGEERVLRAEPLRWICRANQPAGGLCDGTGVGGAGSANRARAADGGTLAGESRPAYGGTGLHQGSAGCGAGRAGRIAGKRLAADGVGGDRDLALQGAQQEGPTVNRIISQPAATARRARLCRRVSTAFTSLGGENRAQPDSLVLPFCDRSHGGAERRGGEGHAGGGGDQPVELTADDPYVAAYYFWDMGRWAVETRQWDLTIAIASAWERAEKAKQTIDGSYLALTRRLLLAQGAIPSAQKDLEALQASSVRVGEECGRAWGPARSGGIAGIGRAYGYKPGGCAGGVCGALQDA